VKGISSGEEQNKSTEVWGELRPGNKILKGGRSTLEPGFEKKNCGGHSFSGNGRSSGDGLSITKSGKEYRKGGEKGSSPRSEVRGRSCREEKADLLWNKKPKRQGGINRLRRGMVFAIKNMGEIGRRKIGKRGNSILKRERKKRQQTLGSKTTFAKYQKKYCTDKKTKWGG